MEPNATYAHKVKPAPVFSRFQKLQELLIITPAFMNDLEEAETANPQHSGIQTIVEVEPQNSIEHTLFKQVHQHRQYMQRLIEALKNDEVISLQIIHPSSLEALQPDIIASLPDAVLIDSPGYHLKQTLEESDDEKHQAFTRQYFQTHANGTEPNPLDLTRYIRQWSVNEGYRTVILNLSQRDVEEDRIQFLVNGADELLDTRMSSDELCVRILSHIRRHLDQYQFHITRQPNGELLQRMFARRQRCIQEEDHLDWSVAVFYVDSTNTYGTLYGQEAKIHMLQNIGALLGQLLHVPDWVFHVEESLFVVLSTPERIERILPIVMKRVDTACLQFLSEDDAKRGFFITNKDALKVKLPLLRVGGGIMSTRTSHFQSLESVLGSGIQLASKALRLGNYAQGAWMSDRLLLGSTEWNDDTTTASQNLPIRPYVMVVEPDAALAFLLEQTVSMNGFEVDVFPSVNDALEVLRESPQKLPNALIVDPFLEETRPNQPSNPNNSDANITPWHALDMLRELLPEALILATANRHNGETPLIHGANAFLPKPYQLLPLLSWLDEMLKPVG
jgi:DNA-binding response OmpR family regulator